MKVQQKKEEEERAYGIPTPTNIQEDVGIMKDMNLDAYRFSISWSRILPKGKLSGGINQEGIKYYNNLIDELLSNGLKPFVTLFHWDLPQALEDEYGGFLSPNIIDDFRDYAEVCFKEFGDRVKHWITLNEPWSYSQGGYGRGMYAPGRCSKWVNPNCGAGDSATEPYLVSHYQLLSHASAVQLYKTKYQESQKGVIGITLVSNWFLPTSNNTLDQDAAQRAIDFMFIDPLTKGDYPESMRSLVGSRLPKFSAEEVQIVKGSYDFIGINYYTTYYAAYSLDLTNAKPNFITDSHANLTRVDEFNDPTLSLEQALNDTFRIDYYRDHLFYVNSAIRDGVNVKGYFAWSLLDNFEWNSGYTSRFGSIFVDYNNGSKRHYKLSAKWFKNFLTKYNIGNISSAPESTGASVILTVDFN
ncbi:Beta-glucosidase [Arachis hypogaea]|nr:Beta-glucosidase [Arachis hypogaea]